MNEILTEIKKTSAFKNYYILSSIFSDFVSINFINTIQTFVTKYKEIIKKTNRLIKIL